MNRVLLAKLQPNQDIYAGLEAACQQQGMRAGLVLSGVGSLNDAWFVSGYGTDRDEAWQISGPGLEIAGLTGEIRFDADGANLATHRGLAIFGRIVMGFLGLELLEAWNLASRASLPRPSMLLRFIGIVVMLLAFGWGVQQIYLRPRQIQRLCDVAKLPTMTCGVVDNAQTKTVQLFVKTCLLT